MTAAGAIYVDPLVGHGSCRHISGREISSKKTKKVEWALAALKPRDPLVQILRRARAQHVVAQLNGDAARVMKFAVHRCHDLQCTDTQIALLSIGKSATLEISGLLWSKSGPAVRRAEVSCNFI